MPKARARARPKFPATFKGLAAPRVVTRRIPGSTRPPRMTNPASTVSTHRARAAIVAPREQVRQMAAAIRDATPTGEVHRIQVTSLLMAALKVCAQGLESLWGRPWREGVSVRTAYGRSGRVMMLMMVMMFTMVHVGHAALPRRARRLGGGRRRAHNHMWRCARWPCSVVHLSSRQGHKGGPVLAHRVRIMCTWTGSG